MRATEIITDLQTWYHIGVNPSVLDAFAEHVSTSEKIIPDQKKPERFG